MPSAARLGRVSTSSRTSAPADPSGSVDPDRPLLILGSQSPSRAQILRQAGLEFSVLVSGVDEPAAVEERRRALGRQPSPAETAEILAHTKAQAVAGLPEAAGHLVLGCDSVFELDGRAYGKPGTGQAVRERLRAMSGRTGILHTGHWLVDRRDLAAPAEGTGLCVSARVSFAAMTPEEIDAYAATGEPLWVAGSFTLEGYGAAFITGVEGDPHAVQGLSVHGLRELLGRLGVGIQRLWRAPEQTA